MSLSQRVYSIGTAATTVVAPVNDYAKYVVKNLQPKTVDEYARDGFIYALFARRDIAAGVTEDLAFTTGPTGAQLDYFQLVAETASIYSEIIEGATVVTAGAAIPTPNLNRNYPDNAQAVIKATSSVTGGSAVNAEFVTASNQGGGAISSQKIVTLKPNHTYVFRATNVGNQSTSWYSQVAFSEHFNGNNNIWLETPNDSMVIRPGEELIMELLPLATINASSLIEGNKLAVMRQK